MDNVEDIRGRRQSENVRFLQELTPAFARRFKVFRYLRDDELGLSQIIADLLDPAAEHGQGTTFLEAMLELLPEVPVDRLGSTAAIKIRVEREITERRRIDITVDIPTEDGPFCLAFENKPYADDQPGQCRDYLEFLSKEYGGRFLLVYLPPRFRMPDESSLPTKDRNKWKNHFCVLPYCHDDAPPDADDPSCVGGEALAQDASGGDDAATVDADASAADGPSLADWFGNCLALCDAVDCRCCYRQARCA